MVSDISFIYHISIIEHVDIEFNLCALTDDTLFLPFTQITKPKNNVDIRFGTQRKQLI